jgi:hypothetical protein
MTTHGSHDMIVGACDAGFEPLPGPPFTIPQDILAEIGTGPHPWTVFYTAPADLKHACRVAFRPLAGPKLTAQTCLAVPRPCAPALRPLLSACASGRPNPNPAQAWPWPMPPSRRNTCPRHLQPDDVALCIREPAGRPGSGAPRSSIRAWHGRPGRPCGTRAITADIEHIRPTGAGGLTEPARQSAGTVCLPALC